MSKVIGITGGIGTGKSAVSNYLINLGYKVLDADAMARFIADNDKEAFNNLVDAFGKIIVLPDGCLNRKKMAEIAFSSEINKNKLEEIITKRVISRIKEEINKFRLSSSDNEILFLDAPTLFETGADNLVDEIWVVTAPEKIRYERVMKRDNCSEDEVFRRISNQMPESEKIVRATNVLDNSKEIGYLIVQINELIK